MSVAGHHLPIWFDEATGPDDGDVSVWNSATGRFESAPVVGGAIPDGTYAPFLETIQALGNMGAAATIGDPAEDGSLVTGTLTANCAITLPTPVAGQSFTLLLTQDGTGGWTATWTGGTVAWPNGVEPVLTTTAAKTDMLVFVAPDTASWRASLVAAAYA